MQQLKGLCAALLVIGLGSSLLEGARMHCDDSTECPEDHCCLTVAEDSICTRLQTLGEFCQLYEEHITTDNPEESQKNKSVRYCPCATGLVCSSAASGSQESYVSASFESEGLCNAAETETDEEQPTA